MLSSKAVTSAEMCSTFVIMLSLAVKCHELVSLYACPSEVLLRHSPGCILSIMQAVRLAVHKARVAPCICMGRSSMAAMELLEHRCVLHLLNLKRKIICY